MKHGSNKLGSSPILTIAIPAYNVEAYLEACLKSLTKTTKDLVEILVIDDGSSDKTALIASDFSKKYPSITLMSKQNGGHGSTINTGLGMARGKYFKLLDGDDFFDVKALEDLVTFLTTTDVDIILTDYVEYYMESNIHRPINNYTSLTPRKVYDANSGNTIFIDKGPVLATTTFKTDLYRETPFSIDEHCFYVDMEYNFFIYQRTKTIIYLPLPLYIYRHEREGQSMQRSSLEKNYRHHEKVCLRLAEELTRVSEKSPKYDYLFRYIVAPLCRSHYQILIEYLKDRKLFLAFDKKLSHYSSLYHSPLVSGKIITIHRIGHGATIVYDALLRKFGGVLKRLEKK